MAATGGSGASATQYDVFLSFRGPDTRNTFTDCLYRTMVGQGIDAYRDSEELEAGNRIDDLLRAVGESKICIPVLSKGYASSAWCLRELALATELNELTGKPAILPIFFDVTPLDVKLRTELYVKDLEKHERRHGGESRRHCESALRKVAEIKGWEVQGKPYGEVIDLVVTEVLRKLKVKQRPLDGKLVGVYEQVEAIMELLDVDSGTGVRFVGIHGMGGIGKTTLAKIIFNELCPLFDGQCSFLDNIRETSNRCGLVDLQKQLASDIFGRRFVEEFTDANAWINSLRSRAGAKKVLIVLDDLDEEVKLKKLVGRPDSFGSGSIVIITTRDKRILDQEQGMLAYEVKEMDNDKALELFSLHAFGTVSPLDAYQSLSREVVSTTGGLPLALEVIGSYLRGKEKEIWEEMPKMLKKAPDNKVQHKLRISYDALEYREKEIFLDIACFVIGEEKWMATYFWEACDLCPHIALRELTDLCLIKIIDGDAIWMHDQLRDLGRAIVRQECAQNLTGLSRLWNAEEAMQVVKSKERKDKVRALNLVGCYQDPITIVDDELEKMQNLKFLKLRGATFSGDINNYLVELRWLSWNSPTLDRRMANFHLKNLVIFKLSYCENTENWGGWKILKMAEKLKVLSLSRCDGLKRNPDFSGCLSLERLSIDKCCNLQKVDPSIGKLKRLSHLDIIRCRRLRTLPEEIGGLLHLKHFSIRYCLGMIKIPDSIGKLASLSELDTSDTSITSLPDSISNLTALQYLDISWTNIVKLPHSIENLKGLEKLYAQGCGHLVGELPTEIGGLSSLSVLDVTYTGVCAVPTAIDSLTRLQKLDLTRCDKLQELPKLPPSLNCLRVASISLRVVSDLSNLTNLVELHLADIGEIEPAQASNPMKILNLQGLGKLFKLEKLRLCISYARAPSTELCCLTRLRELALSDIDSLDSVIVGPQFNIFKKLTKLCLQRCPLREIQLDGLELLRNLGVKNCDFLEGLSIISSSMRKLSDMRVDGCPELLEIRFLSAMESLETVDVFFCRSLQRVCGLSNVKKLKRLHFSRCDGLRVVEGHEELELLYYLRFIDCGSVEIQDVSNLKIPNECRISVRRCSELLDTGDWTPTYGEYREKLLGKMAEKLKVLSLSRCDGLKRTPDFSGYLSLERLSINKCRNLQEVDSSIGKLKCLSHLDIIGCRRLRTLPEEIGGLLHLKHFSIRYCSDMIKIPDSIGKLASLSELDTSHTKITSLPDSIGNTIHLSSLDLSYTSIIELPSFIGEFMQLEFLSLSCCKNLRELPESIGNLTALQNLDISWTNIVKLPNSIENLKGLEKLNAQGCRHLVGELPTEIGGLSSLSILDVSRTGVCAVPTAINSLTCLQKLNLTKCNELQELPKLPPSLICLRVASTSLRVVPDLSNLTNLVKLHLADIGEIESAQASNPMEILNLQGLGKLFKLEKLSLCISYTRALSTELRCLTRLTELTLSDMDSLDLVIVGPQFTYFKKLTKLCLQRCPLREIQLDGLELLRDLAVKNCDFLEGLSIISSSMRKLSNMRVLGCPELLEIRFLSAMESLERVDVFMCRSLQRLCGLSNMKKLKWLSFVVCGGLRVVEGHEELKLLDYLEFTGCGSLEIPNVSSLKIPNECRIFVCGCSELLDTGGGFPTYGEYREKLLGKMAEKLKVLSLSRCDGLKRNPDFSGYLSLERLSINKCRNLQEVDSSIGKLKCLSHLDIIGCRRLRTLPEEIGGLLHLKHFSIKHCSGMIKIPDSIGKLASLSELDAAHTRIRSLPDSIGNATHLSSLDLSSTSITELPNSIGELMQLEFLSLSSCKNLRELPESIGNLMALQNLDISWTNIVKLPNSIENLKGLEKLDAHGCRHLVGELPTEIGGLSSLSILNLSYTGVCAIPTAINSLTRLQKLDLMRCDELQELPKLPLSLICLRVASISLRVVPDLSNLTNLVELHLVDIGKIEPARASNPMKILNLQGLGKLFKLEKLNSFTSYARALSTELGCLPRLRELTLSNMDSLDSVIVVPQFTDFKKLTKLCLQRCPLKEIQLDGLELLRDLAVKNCDFLEGLSIISSSMRKLSDMSVHGCPELLEIRFLSAMESLEKVDVFFCRSLQRVCGLSNMKKLKCLRFICCDGLRVVEGHEELKLLDLLEFTNCGSLEMSHVSNLKIPNECRIWVRGCSELLVAGDGFPTYGEYREKLLGRMAETFKKEDEIEEDTENEERTTALEDSETFDMERERKAWSVPILQRICKPLCFSK